VGLIGTQGQLPSCLNGRAAGSERLVSAGYVILRHASGVGLALRDVAGIDGSGSSVGLVEGRPWRIFRIALHEEASSGTPRVETGGRSSKRTTVWRLGIA
jgi:hypothetical protein